MVTECPRDPADKPVTAPIPKARHAAERPETLFVKPRNNDSLYLQLCKIQQLLNGNDPLAFRNDDELTLIVDPSEISPTPCPTHDPHLNINTTTAISDIDSIHLSQAPPLPYRQAASTITPCTSESGASSIGLAPTRQRTGSLQSQHQKVKFIDMKQRSDRPFRPTPRHLRHFLVLLAKNSGLRASGSSPLQTSTPINSNSSDKSAAALNDLFGPCSTNPYSMHIIKQMPKLLARAIDETDDMELLSINELYNFNRERELLEKKCAELDEKFTVEERIKKGAETLMRLYAKHPKYNRPAANQYINAMKNQAEISEQLVKCLKRIRECNRAHLCHNSAVLAMQLTKCEFERSVLENRQKEISKRLGDLKVFFKYHGESDMIQDLLATRASLEQSETDRDRLRLKCELLSDEIERLKCSNENGVAASFPGDSLSAKEIAQMDFLYSELTVARDQVAAKQGEIEQLGRELKEMRSNFDVLLRQNHAIATYQQDDQLVAVNNDDRCKSSSISSQNNSMRLLEETLNQLDNNSGNMSSVTDISVGETSVQTCFTEIDSNTQTCYTEIDGNVIPDKSHSTAEMEAIAVLEKLREAEQELEAVHEAFGLQRDPSSGAIGLIAAINQRLRDVEGEYNERCMQLESTIEEREQQRAKQLNHISELDAQLIEQTASSELEIKRLETELCGRQLRLDQLRAEYDRELTAVKQESELLRSAGSKSAEQFAAEMQQTINDIRLQHSAEIDSVKRELEQTKLTLNGCLEQLTDQLEMEQQLELLRTQLSQSIEDNQSQAGRWHQENSELRTKLSDLQESMHAIWIQIQAANPMHKPEFQLPSCATDIVDGRSFTEMFAAFFASVESKRKSYERHLDETLLRITHINDDNEQKQVRLKKEYESRIGQVQQSLQELLDEMQNTHQQALEKMRANFTAKLVSSEQQCEELQVQLDALKHQPNIVASDKLNKEYQELLNAFDDLSRKWTDSDAVRRRQETLLINTQKQIRELQSIVLAKEYQLKQLTGDSKEGDGTTDDAAFTQAMESMKDTYEKAIEQQKFENGKLAAEVDRLQRICRLNNISED